MSCSSPPIAHPGRGLSTASPESLDYRLGVLEQRGWLRGRWLDCGAADGSYAHGIVARGAAGAVAVDIEFDRLHAGRQRPEHASLAFACTAAEAMPFAPGSFDGVLLNEVLEHVTDEARTLREAAHAVKCGGVVVVISPNRLFPFEGHGLSVRSWSLDFPVPLVPWLPAGLVRRFVRARNYWPWQLKAMVRAAGLEIVHVQSIYPVFDRFPWLPGPMIVWTRRSVDRLARTPIIRRFGMSTMIVARRPLASTNGAH